MKLTKKYLKVLAASFLVVAFPLVTMASCGDNNNSGDHSGSAMEGWDDNWGKDEWGDGYVPPSSNPDDYNKIDWSGKYGSYDGGIKATNKNGFVPFYPGNGVHKYEAENAELTGSASVSDGTYVGNLDNSSVKFVIQSEIEGNALVVASFATNPDFPSGLPFNQQYSLYCNGGKVDTSDAWIKGTDSWTKFQDNILGEVSLIEGENTIELFSGLSRSNLDYIKLVPTKLEMEEYSPAPEKYQTVFHMDDRIEAEDTIFNNARTEESNSNTGVNISWTSYDTTIEFLVKNDSEKTITRTLSMYAATGLGDETSGDLSPNMAERLTLKVNDKEVALSGPLPVNTEERWYSTYRNIEIARITLPAKSNSKIDMTLSDQINIDYFELIGDPVLTGLTVTPIKTAYTVDDTIVAEDLTVTAQYSRGGDKIIAFGDYELTYSFVAVSDSSSVMVSYTEGEVTKTASYVVRVVEAPAEIPTALAVSSPIYKDTYTEGEKFTLTSLTVTGTYGGEERILDPEDYVLQYSFSSLEGWANELTMPEVDERQVSSIEATVYIRAVLIADSSITDMTSVTTKIYDRWQAIVNEHISYETSDVEGMVGTSFPAFYPGNGVHRYEAEKAVLGGIASWKNNNPYVGDLRENATVTFTIDSKAETNVSVMLVMNMSVKGGYREEPYLTFGDLSGNKVIVNGSEVTMNGVVNNTKDWNKFADDAIGVITLVPGENTIQFVFAADANNFDYIKLVPSKTDASSYESDMSKYLPTFNMDDRIEAEATHFKDAIIENNTNLGWSTDNTFVEFVVENTSEENVTRKLMMHAAAGQGDTTSGGLSSNMADRLALTVNGASIPLEGTLPMTTEGVWYSTYLDIDIAEITLPANSKTTIHLRLSQQINVDYFVLNQIAEA